MTTLTFTPFELEGTYRYRGDGRLFKVLQVRDGGVQIQEIAQPINTTWVSWTTFRRMYSLIEAPID